MAEGENINPGIELFRTEITGVDISRVGRSHSPSLGKPELRFRTPEGDFHSDSIRMVITDEHQALTLRWLLHENRLQGRRLIFMITAEDRDVT